MNMHLPSDYPPSIVEDLFNFTLPPQKKKKRTLTASQQAFIHTLHDIKAGRITTPEQFPPLLTGDWHEYAEDSLRAFYRSGEQGLWYCFDVVAHEYPMLEDYRSQVAGMVPAPAPAEAVVGKMLSEVATEPIEWLWPQRLALGKLTIFDGDPGMGKSNITLDLAARVSTGREMPDGTPGMQGGVVLIAPEDGLSDTIKPRLARAGADLTKIVSLSTIKVIDQTTSQTYERPFSLLEDLERLDRAITRVAARLVIIDPIMAVLGNKDTYKDSEVRALLAPLQVLAERHRAVCIIVRHLTKNGGENVLYRGGGSIAFIGVARTALAVVKDPLDDSRNVLAHIKSNIGEQAPALPYIIASDKELGDERPYIVWGEPVRLSNRELLSPSTGMLGAVRQQILNVLKERYPEALSLSGVAEALPEINADTVARTLRRMAENGQIQKSSRGCYIALQ